MPSCALLLVTSRTCDLLLFLNERIITESLTSTGYFPNVS